MNIECLQKEIDSTEYWDMPILDIQIKYFGDEVKLFIENDKDKCWVINFLSCYKVDYETDANWRGKSEVKNMRGGQLGYYGQDISVEKKEEFKDFVFCSLDLSIMTMTIVCKDISVEELNLAENLFFWQEK